eukprot:Clim_evm8s18 gene=Clim_evmTU8s18
MPEPYLAEKVAELGSGATVESLEVYNGIILVGTNKGTLYEYETKLIDNPDYGSDNISVGSASKRLRGLGSKTSVGSGSATPQGSTSGAFGFTEKLTAVMADLINFGDTEKSKATAQDEGNKPQNLIPPAGEGGEGSSPSGSPVRKTKIEPNTEGRLPVTIVDDNRNQPKRKVVAVLKQEIHGFARKSITWLHALSVWGYLFSIADGMVHIHYLNTYELTRSLNKTKGVTAVAVDVQDGYGHSLTLRDPNDAQELAALAAGGEVKLRIAIAAKRRLYIYELRGSNFIETHELELPQPASDIVWADSRLCCALGKEYVLVNATTPETLRYRTTLDQGERDGAASDDSASTFASRSEDPHRMGGGAATSRHKQRLVELFSSGKATPRIVRSAVTRELFLSKDSYTVAINYDGRPSREMVLLWSDLPNRIVLQQPYVIGMLPGFVEIRTMDTRELVQTIDIKRTQTHALWGPTAGGYDLSTGDRPQAISAGGGTVFNNTLMRTLSMISDGTLAYTEDDHTEPRAAAGNGAAREDTQLERENSATDSITTTNSGRLVQDRPQRLLLLGTTFGIWNLRLRAIDRQIDDLVKERCYNEALILCELLDEETEMQRAKRVQRILRLQSSHLFAQHHFREALALMGNLGYDTAQIISFFPNMWTVEKENPETGQTEPLNTFTYNAMRAKDSHSTPTSPPPTLGKGKLRRRASLRHAFRPPLDPPVLEGRAERAALKELEVWLTKRRQVLVGLGLAWDREEAEEAERIRRRQEWLRLQDQQRQHQQEMAERRRTSQERRENGSITSADQKGKAAATISEADEDSEATQPLSESTTTTNAAAQGPQMEFRMDATRGVRQLQSFTIPKLPGGQLMGGYSAPHSELTTPRSAIGSIAEGEIGHGPDGDHFVDQGPTVCLNLPGTRSDLERERTIIDTALLKVYLRTKPVLLGPLLRIDNMCHVEESERVLMEASRLRELVDLYRGKGLHRKALELLYNHSEDVQSPLTGIYPTIDYLTRLGQTDWEILGEYATWVLNEDWEEAMTIFTDDLKLGDRLDHETVAKYLRQKCEEDKLSTMALQLYLEHAINVFKDHSPFLHTLLMKTYIDLGGNGLNNMEERDINEVDWSVSATDCAVNPVLLSLRSKILSFAGSSQDYNPDEVLRALEKVALLPKGTVVLPFSEERAYIMGQAGRHREALRILAYTMANPVSAKQYCDFWAAKGLPSLHTGKERGDHAEKSTSTAATKVSTVEKLATQSAVSATATPTATDEPKEAPKTLSKRSKRKPNKRSGANKQQQDATARDVGTSRGRGSGSEAEQHPHMVLLDLYLNPEEGQQVNVDAALALINDSTTRIDSAKALNSLPADTPIIQVSEFLSGSLRHLSQSKKASSVASGLLRQENLQVRLDVLRAQQRAVYIDKNSLCILCGKKIGKAATAWHPYSGATAHYACQEQQDILQGTTTRNAPTGHNTSNTAA